MSASGDKQRRHMDRLQSGQVRLVISVPALMFLSSLLLCLIIKTQLSAVAEDMPVGAARDEAEKLADIVLWAGLIGSAGMGVAGLLLAYTIVKPIRRLIRSMEEVAAGNLTKKVEENELGEIGQLGSSFNQMVEHLEDLFKQRDRQMRESAAGTIITLDDRGRVLAADDAFITIIGYDPEKLLRHDFIQRMSELCGDANSEFIEAIKYGINEAREGRTGVSTVEYFRPKSDERFYYSLNFTQLQPADNDSPAFLIDVRDLTGMRKFHEQMQRADRLAALGTLATGIAHEIRNPLAAMKAMTQLLNEDAANAPEGGLTREYLPRVISEIDRLDRLVRSIMDFANTERAPATSVNLNQLATEALEVARHRINIAGEVDLQWALDEAMPECLLEQQRVHQALINLMSNALEALAERGGGVLRVESRVERFADRPLVLRISNSSDPIPPERRKRLFEPFYTSKSEGTGLGLPIAYQIIIANSGTIDVDSGDGMVHFTLAFPFEGAHAKIPRGISNVSSTPIPET